jgi:hypothetical protein
MRAWNGLDSSSPVIKYLLVAVVLVVVIAVGLGIFYLLRSPGEPAVGPDVETPTGSPDLSARGAEATPKGSRLVLPLVMQSGATPPAMAQPSSTPTPRAASATPVTPTKPPTPTPTPTPTPVDFDAVRQELEAEGKDLAHVKIGFHTGPGGNARGLGEYLRGLASAGVPAVIKSVDDYGVCLEALRASDDHVVVFRMAGGDVELPDYDLPPERAAEEHWARILEALPPEFDKRTWLEVMNEPDKARADWLGRCSRRLAELALRDGYRLAAFGWSTGEPEPEDWRTPGMEAFLSLAAEHPDRIAVALHEYSNTVDDIANQYPWLLGRFQMLFQACDELGIGRPTVLITEWGWEGENVPAVDKAMEDIAWASELYAAYPEVLGAALWYLGPGYGNVADQAQKLISPMRYYAWSEYFVIDPGQKLRDPARFAPE